jgi:hypothetical protein
MAILDHVSVGRNDVEESPRIAAKSMCVPSQLVRHDCSWTLRRSSSREVEIETVCEFRD